MRWAALWRQAPRCGHVLRLPVWSSYPYGAVLELFLNLPLHPRHPRFQFGFIANRSRRKRHVNHLGFDLLGGFALGLLETLRQRIALGLPHLLADNSSLLGHPGTGRCCSRAHQERKPTAALVWTTRPATPARTPGRTQTSSQCRKPRLRWIHRPWTKSTPRCRIG